MIVWSSIIMGSIPKATTVKITLLCGIPDMVYKFGTCKGCRECSRLLG